MSEQDAHVLDRRDQVILDLLAPEPPPARAFEVMIIGGISKTGFHQMLSPFAIALGGATVRLAPCYIQGRLFFVPLDGAPHFCPRALGSQDTASAHPLGRLILYRAFGPMESPWL